MSVAGVLQGPDELHLHQTDRDHDFSDLLASTPPGYFPPGVTPQTTGTFTRPVNGQGGYLWGLELRDLAAVRHVLRMRSTASARSSATRTRESDIAIPGSISSVANDHIPLPGLSRGRLERDALLREVRLLGARIATRYRSEYIGEVTNFANERGLRYVDDDMITDAQVSYAFGEGMLEGLQLLFQVNNLTNEPYIAYSVNKSRLLDYQEYGTQYLVGANYRF